MNMKSADAKQARAQLLDRRAMLAARKRQTDLDARHELEPLSADFEEQAVERENDDVLRSIELSSENELRQIDLALRRIDEGRYGLCERCGEKIDPRRLAAQAQAIQCAGCAESEF